ncbi:MAG: thiamine phosphate synthase [Ruminococcaceae bacterium]|nr:thiamine phosphate synthase [Oscillospiraceae bacterium]
MKFDRNSLLLYAITDRTWLNGKSLAGEVEKVLQAGATFLQLREKDLDKEHFLREVKEIKKLTDWYHVPFVINDDVEVAIACGADGVHVGQSDMQAQDIRQLLGPDKIIGVSSRTVEQARIAKESGADYVGVGAVFGTTTKKDANQVTFEELREICASVEIPVVAIGGINETNLMQLKGSGIDGISVISAIFAKPDAAAATKNLLALAKAMKEA